MSRWPTGQDTIEKLLTTRRLQAITGAQANGEPWLTKARRTLETAKHITDDDPESAYVLAYDAARHACTALLTQQGLRRRRNELEYPTYPGDLTEPEESHQAIEHTEHIITAAESSYQASDSSPDAQHKGHAGGTKPLHHAQKHIKPGPG